MREIIVDGFPVVVKTRRETFPRVHRIKLRKKQKKEAGNRIRKLTPKQMRAKEEYIKLGATPDVKREAGLRAGYCPDKAVRGVNSAIKPIAKELDERGVNDEVIVDKLIDGLDAMHPIKPDQKDHHARIKFIKEVNLLKDNYPPKRIQSEERHVVLHITPDDVRAHKEAESIRRGDDTD